MKRVNGIFKTILISHFSCFLSGTADISNIEQASLCIRYILNDQIHEKFLMFIPVTNRSGAGLANLIINSILGVST